MSDIGEDTVDCFDSDVVVLEGDDPGIYLCQEDALKLAQAIHRANNVVPDLTIIRLGRLLASCAVADDALYLNTERA